ncbi:saccharopine dehydrogenase family protein [Paenibacillus sp. IHBB 10380]|uniref:saccharopine dehydrogenase family protein n=1 Tax=Paenibacillus sp. IHBB 10380 TaxID=1566358 RepID=UPI0005CFA9E0|nr:saccharopine dehydrogenase NADP-binding domain-containing protein [Paenibacillus sp. IHBB 10380]AJS60446.1 saccharopine dehydrogenase [Paenibacillus sp. IHBB 10380]
MKQDIVVIGGYGHVGAQICRILGDKYPGDVYAAGRSLERAEQLCSATGGKVKPLRMALGEPVNKHLLQRVKLVVMCLDQQDTSFVKACLESGTHYVDVSANGPFFKQLEALDRSGAGQKATAVLSVGLAPGLTNLLAGQAKLAMDQTESMDISVMLGLGDSHGKAAIEWTVDSLSASFNIVEKDLSVPVNSFTDGKETDFGGRLGRHTAYRFPFSDQFTLPRTLGIPSVSTRLCFDSHLATVSIAVLQKMGLMTLLRGERGRNIAVKSFGKLRFGSERFAVKVDAYGYKDGSHMIGEYCIQGTNESKITAKTAAAVAEAVYSATELPTGVFHLEQLFGMTMDKEHVWLTLTGEGDDSPYYEIDDVECWSRQDRI